MNESILKALEDYLDHPFHSKYQLLVDTIHASPDYNPYSDDLIAVDELVADGKYPEAADALTSMGLARIASPSFQWIYSYVMRNLGNQSGEEISHYFAVQFGQEILRTGKGTEAEPFHVLWLEDEREVLSLLEKEQHAQHLVAESNRHFDVIKCKDGSEVWFDVTRPMSKLRSSLGMV